MDTKAIDKKFLARPEAPENIEIARAENSFFYDSAGKRYIDFLMGWCVGNTGWGNEAIKNALKEFSGPEYVYPGLLYKPWTELAGILADITPGDLVKSFRTTGGTESVEAAMQIAMLYTGRSHFMSIEGTYHGNSLATLSIGDSASRKQFKNLLPNCHKADLPLDSKALKKVEARLKKKDVAAFIMEPIISSLGVVIPDENFILGVRALCKKYGTLFVADEVATGFGRTGKLFASEHFGLKPDIMCLAKAISGGYAGIGATITTEKVAKKVQSNVSLYSTFGWHPVSVQAAIANIRYIMEHRQELLQNTNDVSEVFRVKLEEMKFKKRGDVNIAGLAIGVDVKDSKYAERIRSKCLKNGLLLMSSDTYLVMFPALTIEKDVALKGLDILASSV